MSPLERIEHGIGTYTKAERAVADFFLEHPADVVGSTITSISDASGLSKTALLRMCQRIGYSGYAEFRFSMEKYLNAVGPVTPDARKGETVESMQHLADTYSSYLRRVSDVIDIDQLATMARGICQARRISIWGVNRTHEGVMQLSNRLMRLGIFNQASSDIITMVDIAMILGKGDLCIVFTMNGRGTDYAPLMDSIVERGGEVYLITMNPEIGLIKHATQAVTLPWISRDYEFGTLEDQIIVFMYLEILLDEISKVIDSADKD